MKKINNDIKQDIENKNKLLNTKEKEKIGLIFQFVSLSGFFIIISIIFLYTYFEIEKNLDFETPSPTITMKKSTLSKKVRKNIIKTKVLDLFNLKTEFDKGFFLDNQVEEMGRQNVRDFFDSNGFKKIIKNSISSQIKAVFIETGDVIYNKGQQSYINTNTQATILVKSEIISNKYLSNEYDYYLFKVTFNRDFKIITIKISKDLEGIKNIYKLSEVFYSLNKENFWFSISSVSKDRYPYLETIEIRNYKTKTFERVSPTKGVGIISINNIDYKLHLEIDNKLVYIDIE